MAYNILVMVLSWQLILPHLTVVESSTHWVVTEDGRIQAQMDSIFNLQRPYDLVALLKQEQRAVMLENLKQELLTRKADIDGNEDKDSGLEQKFYRTDSDCIAAGKPLVEFELYQSTVLPLEDKGIRTEEHVDFLSNVKQRYHVPRCTDYIALDFSMHAFEHLEGIKERSSLSLLAELGLKTVLPYAENVDEFGHRVHSALYKNNTSWVLYNMAAFYWRIKGDGYQSIECLRRALHYSPRHHKDVALVSLSNVLHQAHYSNEAAIVIHASIDISRELNVNHFTLGNIYAVLAEYNKSVICFENALRIQPDFDAALRRRHAVLCHSRLETVLESQHRSLQRTLAELRDYQQKHDLWKQQQQKLTTEQAPRIEKIEQTVSYETYKMRLANEGVGEHCGLEERDGHHVLQCAWARVKRVLTDYDFSSMAQKEQVASASEKSESADYLQPVRPPLYHGKKAVFDRDTSNPLYLATDWPSKEECDQHAKKFPMWNEFPTTFLPAENKGFDVRPLLGAAQGLEPGQQHPFPWYPPVCTTLIDIPEGPRSCDHIVSVRDRLKLPSKMADPKMKSVLLSAVDGWVDPDESLEEIIKEDLTDTETTSITQDEIGQRILTALKKKIGPNWVLYNLAALYWRIVGNSVNGIECARRALYFAPDQYRDVPLLNLANILYRVGRVNDAITVMREALIISDDEPESHFFVGNLLAALSNLSGSVYHYRQALAQNPLHREAYNSMRIIMCYQKFHRTVQSAAPLHDGSPSHPSSLMRNKCNQQETVFICTKSAGVESCYLDRQQERCQPRNSAERRPLPRCPLPIAPPPANDNNCILHRQPDNCNPCSREHLTPVDLNNEPLSDTLGNPSHASGLMDDETAEYYRQQGVCNGEECDQYVVNQPVAHSGDCSRQQNNIGSAFERLELVGDKMLHRVFLNGEVGEIRPTECVIFGDGWRSEGCSREEFRAYFSGRDSSFNAQSNDDKIDDEAAFDTESGREAFVFSCGDTGSVQPPPIMTAERLSHPITYDDDPLNLFPNPLDSPDSPMSIETHNIANVVDPVRHIQRRISIKTPSTTLCKLANYPVDFHQPFTVYVSLTTKLEDGEGHIDYSVCDSELERRLPKCDVNSIGSKHWPPPQLADRWSDILATLKQAYNPELDFTNVLLDFDGLGEELETEPTMSVIGSRLALSLKYNSTSWVLNNLASVYWRVLGHSEYAVSCIIAAYHFSPPHAKDIPLLGLASMLYHSGLVDDALQVTVLALDHVPDVVALHFMLANLYAAKGQLKRATLFYESTLGLQTSFQPAVVRLATVLCSQVLGKPSSDAQVTDSASTSTKHTET